MNEQTIKKDNGPVLEMVINDFEIGPITREGYYPISLKTSRGNVDCRLYASAERRRAVVFAGDTIGGWDSPVKNRLYPSLCNTMSRHSINCLRIKYRYPGNLSESILDVLAGVTFLIQDGVETIGLVGHGFGGAAVIQAAAASPLVSTVISLDPQTVGSEAISDFRETQSFLLLEGKDKHGFEHRGPETYFAVKDWLYRKI